MLARIQQNRNTYTLERECKLAQPLWKAMWRFLKKLKIELSYKSGYNRDICTPMFITALFTIAKLWEQPRSLQLRIDR
jgi:hypothetical protein